MQTKKQNKKHLLSSLFLLISSETAYGFVSLKKVKSLETVSQQSKTAYNELDVLAETEAGTELHIREDSSCRIPALRLLERRHPL